MISDMGFPFAFTFSSSFLDLFFFFHAVMGSSCSLPPEPARLPRQGTRDSHSTRDRLGSKVTS